MKAGIGSVDFISWPSDLDLHLTERSYLPNSTFDRMSMTWTTDNTHRRQSG